MGALSIDPDVLLSVRSLSKTYRSARGMVRALDDVSLTVPVRSTVAIAGTSGSGKSTLARCIARIDEADSGEIVFSGRDITLLRGRELREWRRTAQVLFQEPGMSLNPRLTAAEIVAEPLRILGLGGKGQRREAAMEIMRAVGLPGDSASRFPGQFSGGQRARLALARALAAAPRLLVLDETLSSLDEETRRRIIGLLRELQPQRTLTYLVITHDLGLAGEIADEIVVMEAGRVIETGTARELLRAPRHPQTQRLLAAVPGGL